MEVSPTQLEFAGGLLGLPQDTLLEIFRIISINEAVHSLRLVCSLFRDLLSEKEIWWHYCNALFKYPTSTPWEFMGTEAQQKFQVEDPLRYYQKRTLSKRKLRKAEFTCEFKHTCEGSIVRCSLIDDQNIMAFGRLKQIYIWDWNGNEIAGIHSESMKRNPNVEIMSAQMSRELIAFGDDDALSIFDRPTLTQLHDIKSRGSIERAEKADLFLFTKVFKVFFDQREIAYSDGIGIEWRDLRNPTEVTQFVPGRTCSTFYWQPESNYFFYSCYFDGNDAGIFSGLSHNKVAMGDRRMPGQLVQTYEEFKSWPSAIETSGNRLLVSDSRKEVNIFDIDSAELLGKLTGHHDWIVDVRADDDVIITAGNDHQLRIWDLETYDCLATHGELAVGTGLCWVQWNEDYLVTCSENPDCGVYVYKYGASLE